MQRGPGRGSALAGCANQQTDEHVDVHLTLHGAGKARYTVRGSVSLERLGKDESGDLIYTCSRP
jgi:hypothetical protein